VHLVRDAQAFARDGQIGGLLVQVSIVDGDRGLHRESIERRFFTRRERLAILLLAQIEVPAEWTAAEDRYGEQRLHHGMVRRKSG
jgi:hypothetical protein